MTQTFLLVLFWHHKLHWFAMDWTGCFFFRISLPCKHAWYFWYGMGQTLRKFRFSNWGDPWWSIGSFPFHFGGAISRYHPLKLLGISILNYKPTSYWDTYIYGSPHWSTTFMETPISLRNHTMKISFESETVATGKGERMDGMDDEIWWMMDGMVRRNARFVCSWLCPKWQSSMAIENPRTKKRFLTGNIN